MFHHRNIELNTAGPVLCNGVDGLADGSKPWVYMPLNW